MRDAMDILEELGGWPVLMGNKWTDNNFTWYGLAEKANLVGFDTSRILSESEFIPISILLADYVCVFGVLMLRNQIFFKDPVL